MDLGADPASNQQTADGSHLSNDPTRSQTLTDAQTLDQAKEQYNLVALEAFLENNPTPSTWPPEILRRAQDRYYNVPIDILKKNYDLSRIADQQI